MRHFTNVHDLGDLKAAVKEALEVKSNRFAYKHLGQDKTLMMIFLENNGFEPLTPCVQSRCSSQLS